MSAWGCGLGIIVWTALAAAPSRAQQPSWIVVPATTGELSGSAAQLVAAAEAALAERGALLLGADAVPDLGTEPQAVPAELRERLEAAVGPALEDVGFGRRTRVFERVNPLVEEVARYVDALGAEPAAARAVTDLLLIAARAHVEGRDDTSARATLERLVALVPEPDPTVRSHPHAMLELLSLARGGLREGRAPAQLVVRALERGSCAVYVNGRLVGPAPLEMPAYRGDYGVRAQCGEARSRVHFVRLEAGPTTVEISPSLEAAVRTRPRLHLAYTTEAAMTAGAARDAAALASRAGADRALVVRLAENDARFEVVGADGAVLARATTATPVGAEALDATWASIFADRPPHAGASEDRASEWNHVVGASLLVAGLGLLVAPLATLASDGQCADDDGLPDGWCRSVARFGPVSTTLSIIGVAALAAGVVWWVVSPIRVGVVADPTSARLVLVLGGEL